MEDKDEELIHNSQTMATIMEQFIKAHPYDWMWFQHLFWTEPEEIRMLQEIKEKKEKAHE